MSVESLLMEAKNELGIPVFPNAYEGDANDYIVFNRADDRPIYSADDEPIIDRITVQVHRFFKKGDAVSHRIALKNFLRSKGFTVIRSGETYERDTAKTHIIVYASIDEDAT